MLSTNGKKIEDILLFQSQYLLVFPSPPSSKMKPKVMLDGLFPSSFAGNLLHLNMITTSKFYYEKVQCGICQ